MLKTQEKKTIIDAFQSHEKDTGSAQVQVAVLSKEIDVLADHLKTHAKDTHSRRGLLGKVNQRRKLLSYLSVNEPETYAKTIKKLGLKK
jgi:small subunit ribosomal protein S15